MDPLARGGPRHALQPGVPEPAGAQRAAGGDQTREGVDYYPSGGGCLPSIGWWGQGEIAHLSALALHCPVPLILRPMGQGRDSTGSAWTGVQERCSSPWSCGTVLNRTVQRPGTKGPGQVSRPACLGVHSIVELRFKSKPRAGRRRSGAHLGHRAAGERLVEMWTGTFHDDKADNTLHNRPQYCVRRP